jgi:phosphatidylglycerophosphate synthase
MASPAFVTDLPVLVLLIVAWVTVPVFWAHVITGLALIAVIGIHLLTRRRLPLRAGRVRRRVAYASFLLAATTMAATGVMRWAGIPPQYAWHGGISYLALGLALVHVWSVRRVLRARIRTRNPKEASINDR